MLAALGTSMAVLSFAGVARAETLTVGADLTSPVLDSGYCASLSGEGCGEVTLAAVAPSAGTGSPVHGAVVRWRIRGASATPGYSINVLRKNPDGTYTVTASSDPVTPSGNEIETFASSLPIEAGEYVGLDEPPHGYITELAGQSTGAYFISSFKVGETRTPEGEEAFPLVFGWNADIEETPLPPAPIVTPPSNPTPSSTPTPAAVPVAAANCISPRLEGMKLKTARETVKAAHCALGKNIRRKGADNRNGKVVGQTKKPGTPLATESVVRVTLGRGQ
jgi:hypothetical protein